LLAWSWGLEFFSVG